LKSVGHPAFNRRDFFQIVGTVLAEAALLPATNFAFAQSSDQGAVSSLSASQRILLNGVLYKNVDAYLAFAEVARQNIRGSEAVTKFDDAIARISKLSDQDKVRSLDRAIAEKILIDCILLPQQSPGIVSLQQLISPTIPKIGISATMSYQIGFILNETSRNATNAAELLKTVQGIRLLPAVPSEIASKFSRDNLTVLTSDGGLAGLIAISMGALTNASPRASDIETALFDATRGINGLADNIGTLGGNPPGDAQRFSALTGELANAVEALGRATAMDVQTVRKISTSVKVVGLALSGAAAGASFGPYGVAVGAVVGLLGGLFGGGGGADPTLQALSQLDSKISRLQQEMQIGFQQIGQSLVALSRQMQVSFQALSTQIQAFQQQVQANLDNITDLIKENAETLKENTATILQSKIDGLLDAGKEYEFQYRRYNVTKGNFPETSASGVRISTNGFLDTMRNARLGFCSSAFVGPITFQK
jgi:hypothetical protein